jgi:hypothetical protein
VSALHFRRIADDNDQPVERGTYRRIVEYWAEYRAKHPAIGAHWAETCCPDCGRVALLGSNHVVTAGGVVTPSDICPFPPCTFHKTIALDDWDRPSTPRR